MWLLDILDVDPQKVVDFLGLLNITIDIDVAKTIVTSVYGISLFGIGISVIWGAIKLGKNVVKGLNFNQKWRDRYIREGLEHSFGNYLDREERNIFIPTMSQGTPPYNFDEPDEAVTASPKQDLVQMFVDEVFSPDNTNRQLYCILAGSGMGKTTFAVQLFVNYIQKYNEKTLPYPIYIMDMADSKILEKIKDLVNEIKKDSNKSILILDALDENLQAAENFDVFRRELEKQIEPFKYVVITCRSQFFSDEQSEPQNSGIRDNSRDKNLLKYNKVYICPFSAQDIKVYVERKYKKKDRQKAFDIIGKCRHLMARPLLLAYIDDLLYEDQEFQNEADIYEVLINKWIQREVNGIHDDEERNYQHKELLRFSSLLAIKIYQNWKDTGGYRLSKEQLIDFCNQNHFDVGKYQFSGRSLINHDTAGSYKFSHKSFLEYFLAKEYFQNPSFEMSFEGMDMAELFYAGFCKQEYRIVQKRKIFQITTVNLRSGEIGDDITLSIARKSQFDYHHLFYVIYPGRFSEIEFVWTAYDQNIQELIEDSNVTSISITKYEKGIGSLKMILNASQVGVVYVEGEELPKSFVKEASKKGIHVFHNGVTIVSGTRNTDGLSLQMQLRIRMDMNIQLFRMNKMRESEERLSRLLACDTNNEEGIE